MQEKEIYKTPAILVLELAEELPDYPLEAICLIFTIKKYKRCIDFLALDFIKSCSESVMYSLGYKEKKRLLLVLVSGLCASSKIREIATKSVREQRNQRQLEKKRDTLQKEVNLFQAIKNGSNPIEISNEKKKEMNRTNKEIVKTSNEIKKKANKQTVLLGKDVDDNEYWLFAGDKERIYIRHQTEDKEEWNTYSTVEQVNELLNVLVDKGIAEKKLKSKLEKVVPSISLLDSSTTDMYLFLIIS
jgi:hypothetical protein